MAKSKILILGGGFAGVKTVRNLYKNRDLDITIVTDKPTFRYGATIWRASTGYLKDTAYIPIESLLPITDNVKLVFDSVTRIDRAEQTITTKSGKTFDYDYCVIGLGVVTSYFGIDGLEKYSYSIKSSEGFDKFREHLHEDVINKSALDKNYVVVGAGPTGVELAAALRTYLKIIARHHKIKRSRVNMQLVEAAPRVLPTMLPKTSRLTHRRLRKLGVHVLTGRTVKAETKETIRVDKWSIPTRTVIWTAGVTCNPFFISNADQFELNDKKRVVVDDHLRVDDRTFVIGDSAATKYSGLALTALHNASYVAKVISGSLANITVNAYKPMSPVTIIPVGQGWSVFQWRQLVTAGRFASWLRTIYDFIGYAEVMGARPAFKIWLKRNQRSEACEFCKDLND